MLVRRRTNPFRGFNSKRPPTGAVEIDWSHPLSIGLLAAYVPSRGLQDITGNTGALTPQALLTFGSSYGGPGWVHNAANGGLSTLATPALKLTGPGTVFWSGTILGQASGYTPLIGVMYDNTGIAPYYSYALGVAGSENGEGNANGFTFLSGQGNSLFGANTVTTGPQSLLMNWTWGGNTTLYKNGTLITSASRPGTALYTATSTVGIGTHIAYANRIVNAVTNLGLFYSDALGGDTAQWLNVEPYAMMRPIMRRTYYAPATSGGGGGGGTTSAKPPRITFIF